MLAINIVWTAAAYLLLFTAQRFVLKGFFPRLIGIVWNWW